jgi:hypothetical protein
MFALFCLNGVCSFAKTMFALSIYRSILYSLTYLTCSFNKDKNCTRFSRHFRGVDLALVHMPSHLFTCLFPCSHAFAFVHMPSHLFTCLRICSHVFSLVHMSSHLFTCLLPCSHAFALVHLPVFANDFICLRSNKPSLGYSPLSHFRNHIMNASLFESLFLVLSFCSYSNDCVVRVCVIIPLSTL